MAAFHPKRTLGLDCRSSHCPPGFDQGERDGTCDQCPFKIAARVSSGNGADDTQDRYETSAVALERD
jgi:hypothetical protein